LGSEGGGVLVSEGVPGKREPVVFAIGSEGSEGLEATFHSWLAVFRESGDIDGGGVVFQALVFGCLFL
jgi:hypothetical protein